MYPAVQYPISPFGFAIRRIPPIAVAGRLAGPGRRRRRRTAEGGREGLWGIGRKIERKLAARAPPPSVTRVDRPLFSRPPTILEPQGDRRTYVGEFVAPIIEVYPPGACPPGGP